ncbi:DUF3040 domain-containing protein [Kitasatospora sp. NPDC004745]|uniref:DUF3040 domain-containing protein n=1 Tax=unclassified Kitasatospora TaxID=2633591 RepID=UPI00369058CD
MNGPLTDQEQRLLNDIGQHLRLDSPGLHRLLSRRPTLLRRLLHRPRLLAALASVLTALTTACALFAAASGPAAPAAAASAAVWAILLALVFRRLAGLRAH